MVKKLFEILDRYGLQGSLNLAKDKLFTKLFFSNSRLIRLPIYIRGRRFIKFGLNLTTGVRIRIDAFGEGQTVKLIELGDNIEINDDVHIASRKSIKIGNNVLIASKVFITDHNHGIYSGIKSSHPNIPPKDRYEPSNEVVIGNNVWIGEGVIILPGITIGNGAIIGAGSVVTKNVKENTIVAGNPAMVIKEFDQSLKEWKKILKN